MKPTESRDEKMSDHITKVGKSIIQHGKENDRIYLLKLHIEDVSNIISELELLISKYKYTKIFAKVPAYAKHFFLNNDYKVEVHIPNFYNGNEDVFFMAKYFSPERKYNSNKKEISAILETAFKKANIDEVPKLKEAFYYQKCTAQDVEQMADLYKKVFTTYPFPIHDPNYLIKTMDNDVEYFGIWEKDTLIALASSEKDIHGQNAEMTDFATLPEYRGNNLSVFLLKRMEEEMKTQEIKTVYTIARAVSYGMNITFSKLGYNYGGTLINNTNICNNLESMNVWYKSLS